MVVARNNILSWFQRQKVDQRTLGDLFRFCNKEMENIQFLDALKRILQMAIATMLKINRVSERLVQSMVDAIFQPE